MNRFDIDALTWDDLPRRVELAKAVIKESLKHLKGNEKILDFGCGTGLVSLNLVPFVKEVIGIDTSCKMVEIFNKKADNKAIAFCKEIQECRQNFDIIISSMTLHHIKDIKKLSDKFKKLTKKVFIIDLIKEDGTFHTRGNDDVYHFGFSKEELKEYFNKWDMIEYKIIHSIKKEKEYPIFFAIFKAQT